MTPVLLSLVSSMVPICASDIEDLLKSRAVESSETPWVAGSRSGQGPYTPEESGSRVREPSLCLSADRQPLVSTLILQLVRSLSPSCAHLESSFWSWGRKDDFIPPDFSSIKCVFSASFRSSLFNRFLHLLSLAGPQSLVQPIFILLCALAC